MFDGGSRGIGAYLQSATWSIGGRQQTKSWIERDSLRATGVEVALERTGCCPSEKSVALCSKERQEHNKPTELTTYSSFHYSGVKHQRKAPETGLFLLTCTTDSYRPATDLLLATVALGGCANCIGMR